MSNAGSVWDEFQNQGGDAEGNYPEKFGFSAPGDAIAGTITMIRVTTFSDGNRVPELYIATGDGNGETRSVLAGPVQLRRKLADLRPVIGDRIAIRLERLEPRGGGKTLKVFDVAHKRDGGDPVPVETSQPVTAGVAASDLI